MKATVILRNLSEIFWNGGGVFPVPGFLTQPPAEQWAQDTGLEPVYDDVSDADPGL